MKNESNLVMRQCIGVYVIVIWSLFVWSSCGTKSSDMSKDKKEVRIVFLHHSTGKVIWQGGNSLTTKIKGKLGMKSAVEKWFERYNRKHGVNYLINEKVFPQKEPYGWKNYPYDYYNIWVKNGHLDYYQEEPTLKVLTKKYDVIILKHCFPVSKIESGDGADINSEAKTLSNYKLQYEALYQEFQKYPDTRFILWTPAALTQKRAEEEWAKNTSLFHKWMVNEWDQPDDNVFIWDFYSLETEGGLYLKDEYAVGDYDSHPNSRLAQKVFPLFCQRIVNVIENESDEG